LKILIITNLYPLPWEPNRAAFNRQQFEVLTQEHQVQVLVLVPWLTWLKNRKLPNEPSAGKIPTSLVPYFYIPKALRFSYPVTLFFSLVFKIFRIRAFNPDILLLSWAFPDAVAGSLLARILRIPYVVKVHGSDINIHAQYKLRAKQIAWSLNGAKAVLSVSKALSDRMLEIGVAGEKVKVIYNGINHEIFRPDSRADARQALGVSANRLIFLYIGNLKTSKGCADLLAAFSDIAGKEKHADLYFIGDGPARGKLNTKVNNLGLDKRVFLQGNMPHSMLVNWIRAANAVVLPSHNEGVPNVLLESMACGIPVVATSVGGIPEIVSDETGILVNAGVTTELAAALLEVVRRSWDSQTISNSVSRFTWENNIDQLNSVFHNIQADNT